MTQERSTDNCTFSTPVAFTTATSNTVGNGSSAAAAPAVERARRSARDSSAALSPAPVLPAPSTTSSTSSCKLDAVIYAGYEIQVQFTSPYPLDELRDATAGEDEGEKETGSSGLKSSAGAGALPNGNGQVRESGGRFGKKRATPTVKKEGASSAAALSKEARPPALNTNGTDSSQVDSQAAGAPASIADLSLVSPSIVAETDLGSPELYQPSSTFPSLSACLTHSVSQSLSLPHSLEPSHTSHLPEVPDSQPPSATSITHNTHDLPFQQAVPTTPLPLALVHAPLRSTSSKPPSALPVADPTEAYPPPMPSTSGTAPPIPAPISTTSATSGDLSPASASRGKGGRFLPKPPGSTQKARRAAARAAKAAGGTLAVDKEGTGQLTQRQQREQARKVREEQLRAEKEKDREREKGREKERLFVCERCFKYFAVVGVYKKHQKECRVTQPPGRRVYQRGASSIWEVNGATAKLYCQNLCLFAKLFIEHKYMFFDVEGFSFYLLTETMSKQEWVLGYFSKEKLSYDDYNLACIVVFPPFRQKGWATLLIEFSYELSRRLSLTPGTPERPLSDLGQKGYLAHWTAVLVRYFRAIFTLRSEPPLIDTLLQTLNSANEAPDPRSSPIKEGDDPEEGARRKRLRRSAKGWDGELPAGALALSTALSASPAKAFTLRLRPGGPRQPLVNGFTPASDVDGEDERNDFAFPTTLDDLAEAVNLRAEDVAFAMVESGLAAWRRGGKKRKDAQGDGEELDGVKRDEVKMEEDEAGGQEMEHGKEVEEEESGEEQVVITPELVELVAREKKVKAMPMLDVAYVLDLAEGQLAA